MRIKHTTFNMNYCSWHHVHSFMVAHSATIVEAFADKITVQYFEKVNS